jgi:hypothetical protein
VADEALTVDGAKLLEDSVQQLSSEDIDRLLRGLPPALATELVKDLIGNKLDPRRLKHLGPLLVTPLRKRPAARLSLTMERLTVGVLETFSAELGDRFDDPSFDDLREVIDAVLAAHAVSAVRCTLAWVAAEEMPAAKAAHDLLLADDRLRLPAWPAVSTPAPGPETTEDGAAED